MPSFHLSLLRETVQPNEAVEAKGLFGALWLEHGKITVNGSGPDQQGSVFLQGRSHIEPVGDGAGWLRFALTETPVEDNGLLSSATLEVDGEFALLRLDTVTFPPGACAWRHVHAGPGIRHLLQGSLHLTSNDHETRVQAGDSWFEPANTPVKALASPDHPKTGFVRFMVLPTDLVGKPSICILDEADAAKPRLQVTHRHQDHVVRLPQG